MPMSPDSAPVAPPLKRWRGRLVSALKLALAAGLLLFLVRSERLSLAKLDIFRQQPLTLAATAGVWLTAGVALAAMRWWLLLRGLGVTIKLSRLVAMQMIGGFFALVLPSLGSDVVRILYGAREQSAEQRSAVVLSVLLDRICGLVGLFFASALGLSLDLQASWAQENLRPLLLFAAAGTGGSVLALLSFQIIPAPLLHQPVQWVATRWPWSRRLTRLIEALLQFQTKRVYLYSVVGLSIVTHITLILYYRYLTSAVTGHEAGIAPIMAAVPLAMLVTSVPLTPGGFGIGHVAFDRLFTMVGLSGGADVFNVAILGHIALSLLGVFPYLWFRTELRSAEAAAAAVQAPADRLAS